MAVKVLVKDWKLATYGGKVVEVEASAADAIQHADIPDYITDKTGTIGPITLDADKTGFTVDLASLDKRWIKFCVKGTAANLTATLTPK